MSVESSRSWSCSQAQRSSSSSCRSPSFSSCSCRRCSVAMRAVLLTRFPKETSGLWGPELAVRVDQVEKPASAESLDNARSESPVYTHRSCAISAQVGCSIITTHIRPGLDVVPDSVPRRPTDAPDGHALNVQFRGARQRPHRRVGMGWCQPELHLKACSTVPAATA